jgi:hypothetical protein
MATGNHADHPLDGRQVVEECARRIDDLYTGDRHRTKSRRRKVHTASISPCRRRDGAATAQADRVAVNVACRPNRLPAFVALRDLTTWGIWKYLQRVAAGAPTESDGHPGTNSGGDRLWRKTGSRRTVSESGQVGVARGVPCLIFGRTPFLPPPRPAFLPLFLPLFLSR